LAWKFSVAPIAPTSTAVATAVIAPIVTLTSLELADPSEVVTVVVSDITTQQALPGNCSEK
jgi:hypothetical protein